MVAAVVFNKYHRQGYKSLVIQKDAGFIPHSATVGYELKNSMFAGSFFTAIPIQTDSNKHNKLSHFKKIIIIALGRLIKAAKTYTKHLTS